jgi:hypothetical protein
VEYHKDEHIRWWQLNRSPFSRHLTESYQKFLRIAEIQLHLLRLLDKKLPFFCVKWPFVEGINTISVDACTSASTQVLCIREKIMTKLFPHCAHNFPHTGLEKGVAHEHIHDVLREKITEQFRHTNNKFVGRMMDICHV